MAKNTENNEGQVENLVPVKQEKKAKVYYFKNVKHAGLTVNVQNVPQTDQPAETAQFIQYRDLYKGDPIRVGFLATESEKVAEICRADLTCEEIEKKEYDEAVVGTDKVKPLDRAPMPAV